jgi:hypothetical protein
MASKLDVDITDEEIDALVAEGLFLTFVIVPECGKITTVYR